MKKRSIKEIESEITEWELVIKDKSVPGDEKEVASDLIKDLKEELRVASAKSGDKPSTKEPGKKAKKAEKKEPVGKKAKKQSNPKKKPAGQGKPDCEDLEKAWNKRREAAKKSANKTKTRSIFEIITDKIETAVEKVIKDIPAGDLDKGVIKDLTELKDDMKKFLESFKKVLGTEFEKEEVQSAVSSIQKLIDGLGKKVDADK